MKLLRLLKLHLDHKDRLKGLNNLQPPDHQFLNYHQENTLFHIQVHPLLFPHIFHPLLQKYDHRVLCILGKDDNLLHTSGPNNMDRFLIILPPSKNHMIFGNIPVANSLKGMFHVGYSSMHKIRQFRISYHLLMQDDLLGYLPIFLLILSFYQGLIK